MEEDGRRWKKMDEKKSSKKVKTKKVKKIVVWKVLGTLVGVQIAQKNILGIRLRLLRKIRIVVI